MFFTDYVLLNASGSAGLINMLFIGAMLAVFYFFMIRPQARKQREQGDFMSNLKEGDKVVMGCGILGRINRVEKDMVTLEIGAGTKTAIRVLKSAISKDMTDAIYAEEN